MTIRHHSSGRRALSFVAAASLGFFTSALHAQISLTSAVDLALRNSPRVKMSEAEVAKARAALSESKDVFIPALSVGAGLGQSYGYSPNPPTLFNFTANSLIYNASQLPYIHAARAGFNAARQSLEDVREAVAEDAAQTFLNLAHDQEREAVLEQEYEYSNRLLSIVQDRYDAGRDSRMDLTQARLSAAQLHVARLRTQGDLQNDREHLARLMGVPPSKIRAEGDFPAVPLSDARGDHGGYANAAVEAAFDTAHAKEQTAVGDAKFLFRPNVALVAQYNRYATFTNSFKEIKVIDSAGQTNPIGANEGVFGVQINVPLFDRFRRHKNQESASEASRALHEAEYAQMQALDGQSRLSHSLELLQAQAEVANQSQQLAQEQLEAVQLQMTAPTTGAPLMTPKDEQNSRISEREKYMAVLDSSYQLHQAELSLLRQTGNLIDWLTHAGLAPPPLPPAPTLKHP